MMGMFWVVLFVALTGSHLGYGLPVRSTPPVYPHEAPRPALEGWGSDSRLYTAVPALALVFTAVGLLFGCTWCYRHKDCKLFSASATHLHDARRTHPPDSGFSEPVNNNVSEANNNGPISLREMQNIANNNAGAYIVSENEERNRVSRESVVEFEPLPSGIRVADPLEHCADWFGVEDFPRNRLQYLREIGRGWFGRVVEGEIEEEGSTSTVAVKILNQNASLEDKARFLDEARVYRDLRHENILAFLAKCLEEDPWILIYELCPMDLQQYLTVNSPKMAILNESGVPLQLMCDVTSGLAYLHSRGYLYGYLSSDNVLVREVSGPTRAVLGHYAAVEQQSDHAAPETQYDPPQHTSASEVWALGSLVWRVCAWGAAPPRRPPAPPPPALPCPYAAHLYQVMQLCWDPNPEARPTSAQVHALLHHLLTSQARADTPDGDAFEARWQTLKPNTIPKLDEHRVIVHAPSTSHAPHHSLAVDADPAVSRSSSIMSDREPLSVQIKSESLNNLHGSLDDVRNIYLTHNETAALECHQGNIALEDKDHDRSDGSVDPWLKDIIAGSQDDVSYYKDVSDVIKNLDNILNSEKTSSSESSHQASPSRDNLSLDCKKEYPAPSSLVKSPGINNFQNILQMGFDGKDDDTYEEEELDRDTVGTLSHSFERHSDTISQQTLENLTPDTPIKDNDILFKIGSPIDAVPNENLHDDVIVDIEDKSTRENTELPKEVVECSDSRLPKLKELCVASISSVSETNEQLNIKDCETSCDNLAEVVRTDTEVKTKSIVNAVDNTEDTFKIETVLLFEISDLKRESETPENAIVDNIEKDVVKMNSVEDVILPTMVSEVTLSEDIQPHVDAKSMLEDEEPTESKTEFGVQEEDLPSTIMHSSHNVIKPPSDLISSFEVQTVSLKSPNPEISFEKILNSTASPNELDRMFEDIKESIAPKKIENDLEQFPNQETPEPVQNIYSESIEKTEKADTNNTISNYEIPLPILPPEIVQNITDEENSTSEIRVGEQTVKNDDTLRSDNVGNKKEQSNNSTAYMDLINNTISEVNDNNSQILQDNTIDNNVKEIIKSCLETTVDGSACSLVKNESTVYLDLPSILKETDIFLHSERVVCSQDVESKDNVFASTPKGSDSSADNTLENSTKENVDLFETKVPEYGPGFTHTKLEQKSVPDSMSPFESPSKSHHTDTYDENSSVVLGPFENCTIELFKGAKSELVDLPKEELLAFSSNFSEINLETPSPLRDGNFLNEVPDIIDDDLQFDDTTVSESKPEKEPQTDETDDTKSGTAKRVSSSTPPNSPGIFLASTSQQKYLVDIDLDAPEPQSYPHVEYERDSGLSSLQKEIDLNQIELQITSKLAMAENENNLNIEYSGPLTVEGLVSEEDEVLRESDAIPESFLAGNGGSVEDLRGFTLDEECVKALRNELELKLPLAQVASIEPAHEGPEAAEMGEGGDAEWAALPPPPELVVSYCGGALSPIAEETRHQLSAYENDAWNASTRTDSSESYPEPCNLSTDEVTDLPTAAPSGSRDHSTYTIDSTEPSGNDTYTVQKDVPSSKEMTMSADSLNGSPYKKPQDDTQSPIDDRTYNKNEEKESNCERISQVSPFLMSPTNDTSAPVDSDNIDNATGVSTLSKTTVPTDAKLSKPSECLSKATSIDSWCSNDTLYNVEENFDDLAMDADGPIDFEKEDKSESTDTLTHNEDDKELSHCSTYIVHDSKSEACETFSPDSITANDNYTYTKVKTDATVATPSVITKSELDSTKNTQTKDLAYGTLPSYSNCTTELISGFDDTWRLPQPELVRRSPVGDDVNFTPPRMTEEKEIPQHDSPQTNEPCVKKMDSVEISCLEDDLVNSEDKSNSHESTGLLVDVDDSPKYNYRNMAPSVTSTPITDSVADDNDGEPIPMELPKMESPEYMINNIPNFQTFLQSAEIRPQDLSSNSSNEFINTNQDTELLLEGDSKTISRNSNRDSMIASERTPTYSDFENSAVAKPQDVTLRDRSSQSVESGVSSGDFRQFESSVKQRPQDLSSVIDASSMLLNSERKSSDLALGSSTNLDFDLTSQSGSRENHQETLDISPPNISNLKESQNVNDTREIVNIFVTDFDNDEETEQPHSIIITDMPMISSKDTPNRTFESHDTPSKAMIENTNDVSQASKEGPNRTYNSHTDVRLVDLTFDSHASTWQPGFDNDSQLDEQPKVNGLNEEHVVFNAVESDKVENEVIKEQQPKMTNNISQTLNYQITNGSLSQDEDVEINSNGAGENFAIVSFLNESFEELVESNVDDNEKDIKSDPSSPTDKVNKALVDISVNETVEPPKAMQIEGMSNGTAEDKVASVTENFLENEKTFCGFDSYLPLLGDIRFTGPASEIMSTSFTQDETEPTSPECEQDSKPDTAAEIMKEWDSDSESHSSNSSSGEFIWKDGDGHETAVVPSTHFDHQRGSGSQASGGEGGEGSAPAEGAASECSGDSGSGSEGDEVEFVPSSWDCRAAPSKSSLRSLEQAPPDSKKRVVFKRQKYHCVYEYPREAADADAHSPAAYLPDFSTYCEWDPSSAEEAELGYGQLFGAPNPLDMYSLRSGIAFGADYDEDFFISSSARPFESLGIMSTSSQFFPGMHLKPALAPREEFPAPPSPPPATHTTPVAPALPAATPSLDFTTPDSGVEDITPGSTDEDFKKLVEDVQWKAVDSASSSESVSPSSPGEALGGLRHTRDKLKLDLPPSPHVPSPRHARVFNFVLDKPRPRPADERTPLVMTDDTPVAATALALPHDDDPAPPAPTFSTFGKTLPKNDSDQKIILTDEGDEAKDESPVKAEVVKGEGTVLDSGDEDSGIESSSKATLERDKTPNVS